MLEWGIPEDLPEFNFISICSEKKLITPWFNITKKYKNCNKLVTEMCNREKNLAIGIKITIYELTLGYPNRLKLPPFFVQLNRLHLDCISITSLFYMADR